MIVVLTGGEQADNYSMSDAGMRAITQGLQEGHGLDKGIAIACKFFDFETTEHMLLGFVEVRCIAC